MAAAVLELTTAIAAALESAAQLAIGSVPAAILFGAVAIATGILGAREYDAAVNR